MKQRYIKFRGKRIDNGQWSYGYLVVNKDGKCYIKDTDYNVNNGRIDIIPDEVHPESVGQYTGIKDANGKEIYEGDIVQYGNGLKKVIVFKDGSFRTFSSLNSSASDHNNLHSRKVYNTVITVIGNIYENPELL